VAINDAAEDPDGLPWLGMGSHVVRLKVVSAAITGDYAWIATGAMILPGV
jgi:acetyltransferase-like isoleucine patch superfamily enzyme